MPMHPDDRGPLWDAPKPKSSGKVRVVALVFASLAAWGVVAGITYLITRWAGD
ncbi:hypothetical protein [Brevundimonas intermedia]|uniref:hypothetical protein n=1 Tax=Brevundimonas intermedia TaxID=74315 RepID=UPI00143026C9|nr:hypothetical protein [Brevundimonas intermedia]